MFKKIRIAITALALATAIAAPAAGARPLSSDCGSLYWVSEDGFVYETSLC